MSALNLALLGPFEGSLNGNPLVKFRTSRAQALLVYLVTEFALGASHQARESLMELLWPGMPPSSARTNLRQNLYYLRKSVPPALPPNHGEAIPFLLSDRQSVAVNADYPLEIDVQRFIRLLARSQEEWLQAVALYRGEFLTDFYLPDTNPFEEWAAARREAFRRQALNALEGLIDSFVAQGLLNDAERYGRRQLAIDPLRETAYRQLMKVLYWSGRRAEALKLYLECVRVLDDELDAPPSESTRALAESIREGIFAGLPEMGEQARDAELGLRYGTQESAGTHEQNFKSLPTVEEVGAVRHNLPTYATLFIGRETELAALDGFIADPSVRLVTIVGPGGIGKTRLATEAAERFLATRRYPDGLLFIDLAPLQKMGQILEAIADGLSFPLLSGDSHSSRRQLLEYLRHKKIFFVFDNFEHLLDIASLAADILQAGPEIKILVTSRERLHLLLEQVYPIQGLEFPDSETPEGAAEYTAVRLFLQSARRNLPDFAIHDDDDLAYLAHICRMVGGMPLALELAASWVDTLTLDEIAGELQQGLDILETELSDVPERQRSVRATFDYTWHKLDDVEQVVFAQLSIFRGGFTSAAFKDVTGASLRQLSQLVNKSLIRFDEQRGRYEIHELLRQFGGEKLGEQLELESITYDRYSDYYLQLLAGLSDDLKGTGKRLALSIIETDLKNLQLAWDHAIAKHNFEAIGLSLESLWRFYWDYGRSAVGDFEKAVAELRISEATEARGIVLGRLLAPLGREYTLAGDTAKAKEILEESLDLLQRLGASDERLIPLLFLAELAGSMEDSNRLYKEGLALARVIGDQWATGHALMFLGWNSRIAGDYQEAEQQLSEALKQFRQTGDMGGISYTLSRLSLLATDRGRLEDAEALALESWSITEGFNPIFRSGGLWALAHALLAQGKYEKAEELFRRHLALSIELGNEGVTRGLLFRLGEIAFYTNNYTLASQQYRESLAGAYEHEDSSTIMQNHNALGRLDVAQGNQIGARRHFHGALQSAISLNQRPLLLDCLAPIAELFAEEGHLNEAALLTMLIMDDPASRAMIRERSEHLQARIEKSLTAEEMDAIRQSSEERNLSALAAQLLLDLETT